nr:alpha/beta hydrolase [uncultured Shimia sp.]
MVGSAQEVGAQRTLVGGSNTARQQCGRNEDGFFDETRSQEMSFLDTIVALPPGRDAGDAPDFRGGTNPEKNFVIARQNELADLNAFTDHLRSNLNQKPKKNREITVFVHGYLNVYTDSLFRLSQLREDLGIQGTTVNFDWPSAGKTFGYNYDRESVLFARDDLEQLLRALPATNSQRIQ